MNGQRNLRFRLGLVSGIVGVFILGLLPGCGQKDPRGDIPKELYEVIFEGSRFSAPSLFRLPAEDPQHTIERLRGRHNLEPMFISHMSLSLERPVLDLLIDNGYMEIEKIPVSWSGLGGSGSKMFEVLKYSEKIKPHVLSQSKPAGAALTDTEWAHAKLWGFQIVLHRRELKSVNYSNKYTESGAADEFFAVKFSYSMKKEFPLVAELANAGVFRGIDFDKLYKGEAKARFDPGYRRWELTEISLEE